MSVLEYFHFLADVPRVDAFRRALEATVSPGQVVLDLGTGIGTYAMFAARAGARVLAVEADPVIDVARGLAADNGFSDRIHFLRGRVEHLAAPERADLLVFEDFSPYLYHPETAGLLLDVRQRWLKDGARAIPRCIRVIAGPVCCPETYASLTPGGNGEVFGLDVRRLARDLLNRLHAASWNADVLLGTPQEIASVDPLALEGFGLRAEARWRVTRGGELHGLGLWMDLELADGVSYSNAPSGHSTGWDQQFLPLLEPVRLREGDEVTARIATLGPTPREPTWWSWRVGTPSGSQEMNTFRSVPLSLERLQEARLDQRLRLTRRGRIRREALQLIDGKLSIGEIARELVARFPELSRAEEVYRVLAGELELESAEAVPQATQAQAEVR